MKIKFWGVRGSYPVPGIQTNKYGGNTPCVTAQLDDGALLIFDAGTGIRELGHDLMQNGFAKGTGSANLFLTHIHWDHIQGFPYFAPLFVKGNQFTIHARKHRHGNLREVFAFQNQEVYSTISFNEMKARMNFVEIMENQTLQIGSATVRTIRLNHPSVALGYRVDADGKSFAYVTDTAPYEDILIGDEFIPRPPEKLTEEAARTLKDLQQKLLAFLAGVDLMVYDTFFRLDDYKRNPHWGHSTPEHGIDLCREAGIGRMAMFHHAPGNTDDIMDQIEEYYREQTQNSKLEVSAAVEGQEIAL